MRRIPLALIALFNLGAAACGEDTEADDGVRMPVTVMTRNLYLGSDLADVVLSTTQDALLTNAESFWQAVLASDIPGRAKLLAAEIAATAPDLIGLQEVEMFRTQTPSDLDFAAPLVNAETVAFDFLALLQAELTALGQTYVVAAVNTLSDVEAPARAADGTVYDLRMTDRDVILAKTGVVFSNPISQPFSKYVQLQLAGLASFPALMKRGYSTIDVTIAGSTVVFANVHLEVGGLLESFQRDQALELISVLRARKGQLILVGDINSAAGNPDAFSYNELERTLDDAWPRLPAPVPPGKTCCRDLAGPPVGDNGSRIDVVMTRGPVTVLSGSVTGQDPAARTPGGLAASDHAGVVMQLGIKPAPAAP